MVMSFVISQIFSTLNSDSIISSFLWTKRHFRFLVFAGHTSVADFTSPREFFFTRAADCFSTLVAGNLVIGWPATGNAYSFTNVGLLSNTLRLDGFGDHSAIFFLQALFSAL